MNRNTFRMPARRTASVAAVVALAAGPVVLLAAPAQATGVEGSGTASASVLTTGLDVSLLNKTVEVPLDVTLNQVKAPANADRKALSVRLDGVDQGRPFSVLSADVADAKATVDAHKAEGYTNLVHASVHVPGLPLLSLVEVQQVTSKAVCAAGEKPTAQSNLLGDVTVLGKRVSVSAGGPTRISVPGVGDISLSLSQTHTTSNTAAATALALKVSVNPLKLNVADVKGTVTLASASCATPKAPNGEPTAPGTPSTGSGAGGSGGSGGTGGSAPASPAAPGAPVQNTDGHGTKPDSAGSANLAETGGSSATPYIAGGAAVLLVAGGGAVALTRRGRRATR